MLFKFLPVKVENFIESLNSFVHHSPKKNNLFCHYAPTSLYNSISSFFQNTCYFPKDVLNNYFCIEKCKMKTNQNKMVKKKETLNMRDFSYNLE